MRTAFLVASLTAFATVAIAAPKTTALVILIDRSGSMKGPKLESTKEATKAAFATLTAAQVVVPMTTLGPDHKTLDAA